MQDVHGSIRLPTVVVVVGVVVFVARAVAVGLHDVVGPAFAVVHQFVFAKFHLAHPYHRHRRHLGHS